MSAAQPEDFSNLSMMELFRVEAETQCAVLSNGLLAIEANAQDAGRLEELMRAAHSLKGAARIVGLNVAVKVAHVMEDCFVAAQKGRLVFKRADVDRLLSGVDVLTRIAQTPDAGIEKWDGAEKASIDQLLTAIVGVLNGEPVSPAARSLHSAVTLPGLAGEVPSVDGPAPVASDASGGTSPDSEPAPLTRPAVIEPPVEFSPGFAPGSAAPSSSVTRESSDRVLRVTADNLNRLLGLAGESLVESRWLNPFADSLLRLKRYQFELGRIIDQLRETVSSGAVHDGVRAQLNQASTKASECRRFLSDRLTELEMYDRRSANLSNRLYHEALACRMRPFSDGVHGFPRMMRDLARSLGREVKLEILGPNTQVDRDILEKLEAPLTHLLRNALDHGMETPEERQLAGKPRGGTIRLEARHSAGMLLIVVSDDGRGIPLDPLRRKVVQKKLTTNETAGRLSESELLEFLFLPGFSMKESVTEISGRGVGLDVVQTMVNNVRGTIRVSTQPGRGTRFQLQLPLTLSVMRTLLVEIAGEPYAFPLAYITRTLRLPRQRIQMLEGRQHFEFDGRQIGLVTAHQILDKGEPEPVGDDCFVVVLSGHDATYGVVVDRFLGERELVVQPLDPRLGKVKDLSAGALMENGSPVLIVDAEDLIRSIEKIAGQGRFNNIRCEVVRSAVNRRKRVLVVDDSLTVRELERKILVTRGYEVEMAVDGMDGWNAARGGNFQLIITDVDMPRMDGIELVTQIKRDPRIKSTPTMIVSYKDREEDRQRGLNAGADYYLTKGSFHDDTLVRAVVDLIGEAAA